eukprot:10801971-Lingulodinium_polyedra.AAC.1
MELSTNPLVVSGMKTNFPPNSSRRTTTSSDLGKSCTAVARSEASTSRHRSALTGGATSACSG